LDGPLVDVSYYSINIGDSTTREFDLVVTFGAIIIVVVIIIVIVFIVMSLVTIIRRRIVIGRGIGISSG
jgi:uncharacterized membrane protein